VPARHDSLPGPPGIRPSCWVIRYQRGPRMRARRSAGLTIAPATEKAIRAAPVKGDEGMHGKCVGREGENMTTIPAEFVWTEIKNDSGQGVHPILNRKEWNDGWGARSGGESMSPRWRKSSFSSQRIWSCDALRPQLIVAGLDDAPAVR
jgi:hypothetical protein